MELAESAGKLTRAATKKLQHSHNKAIRSNLQSAQTTANAKRISLFHCTQLTKLALSTLFPDLTLSTLFSHLALATLFSEVRSSTGYTVLRPSTVYTVLRPRTGYYTVLRLRTSCTVLRPSTSYSQASCTTNLAVLRSGTKYIVLRPNQRWPHSSWIPNHLHCTHSNLKKKKKKKLNCTICGSLEKYNTALWQHINKMHNKVWMWTIVTGTL